MKTVSSRQNPIVRTYRALARDRDRRGGRVLLDGLHLVEDARAAGLRIVSAAFSADALRARPEMARLARRLEESRADVVAVTDAVMAALSPVRTPSGVVAVAERDPADLARVFADAPQLVLLAVDLQDPGNLGAVVRTAEAAGATGVVACGRSADPLGWKALRGSMGSALRLPVANEASVEAVISAAKSRGLSTLAAVPRGGAAVYDFDLTGPVAFLIGAEGSGLSFGTVAQTDGLVSIPMRPPVESLNVAIAAGLLCYEAFRQRMATRT